MSSALSMGNPTSMKCRCRASDPGEIRGRCSNPHNCLGTAGDDLDNYCEHCIDNKCRRQHQQASLKRADPTGSHRTYSYSQCKCSWNSNIGCKSPKDCNLSVSASGQLCAECKRRSCTMRRISSREYYKQFSRKTGRYFAAKREDMNRPSRGTGSTTYESIVPAADSEIPSASSNTSHFMVQDDHKHPSTASQGVSDHIPAHPCSSEVPLSVVLASSNSNTHMDFEPDDGPYHDFHHDQQLPSASNLAIPSELLSPFNAPLSPLSNFLATHAPGPGERQNTHECICRRGWQCWVNDICKDSVVVEGERCQVCTFYGCGQWSG